MLLPLIKINTKKDIILYGENRMGHLIPTILTNKNFNYNYIYDLDKYIGDRIGMRDNLQNINNKYYQIINKSKKIADFYLLLGSKFYEYIGNRSVPYTFDNLDTNKISTNIDKFYDFCSLNKIKCFIIVAPMKNHFIQNKISRKIDYINLLNSKLTTKHKIINPYPLLEEAHKKDNVFYIFDHHLNNYGALQVWNLLLENIGLPKIENVEYEETEYKCTTCIDYKYDSATKYKYIISKNNYIKRNNYYKNKKGYNKKIMIIGTSFSSFDNISYSHSTFRESLYFVNDERGIKMTKYTHDVKKFKPDYLVIYINSKASEALENFMNIN